MRWQNIPLQGFEKEQRGPVFPLEPPTSPIPWGSLTCELRQTYTVTQKNQNGHNRNKESEWTLIKRKEKWPVLFYFLIYTINGFYYFLFKDISGWIMESEWWNYRKRFLAYYRKVCHGFMTASEFSKAGEPSNQLGLKEIHFCKSFPMLDAHNSHLQLRTDNSSSIKDRAPAT